MDKQIQSVKRKKSQFWILLVIILVVVLIIVIIYLSPLLKQEEPTGTSTETESPETFIFSDIDGEVDLDDIENAIKGALNQ